MPFAALTGWGMFVPNRVLTNADLEQIIDTSDEWIATRTGIRERRIAGPGEGSTSMGAAAACAALERAGLAARDVELLVVATTTPDQLMPSAACEIPDRDRRRARRPAGPQRGLLGLCIRPDGRHPVRAQRRVP